MDRHDLVQPLLTDYVLGELPGTERQQVEDHLTSCDACATEARELSLALQSIGLAEEPVAPPPHLRARVLRGLERDRFTARPTEAVPIRRRWPRIAVAVAVAAAVVAALGGLLTVAMQRNAELRRALAQADAEAGRLATQIAETRAQADLAVSILTASDMHRIDLTGFEASRDATARAYWSPRRGLLIVADRLPAPPPGRIYQVWIIESGSAAPVSAGLINSTGGRGMLIVPPPGGVGDRAITVAVTDEPPGGLTAPTGSKQLAGS